MHHDNHDIQGANSRPNQDTQYTDLMGCVVQVDQLDWLEDGYYYDDDEYLPCARYCIGDEDGDGISVWLNADMQEVDA